MKIIVLIIGIIGIVSCNNQEKLRTLDSNEIFPLKKGNQWVYEADVKYHDSVTDSLLEKKMQWTMEVVDTIHHAPFFAAVIKGFPTDLVWYGGKAERSNFVLLQDSNKIYLCSSDSLESLITYIRSQKDSLIDLRDSQDMLFDFPLTKGKTWGADPEMPQRADSMYAWVVKKPATDTSAAEIQYMTNPDHSIFQFQPGVGITGYYYQHHGTVMELKMKLIKKILH